MIEGSLQLVLMQRQSNDGEGISMFSNDLQNGERGSAACPIAKGTGGNDDSSVVYSGSGMNAQQINFGHIANNLADSSTVGFRQRQLQFQDMIYQNLVTPGAAQSQETVSAGLQIGLGTKSAASEVIMTQGDRTQTNNPLDLAIQGTGFFQVTRPDGTMAYTRAGNFYLNNQAPVEVRRFGGTEHHDTANATAITITQYGVVNATLPGSRIRRSWGRSSWRHSWTPGDSRAWDRICLRPPSPRAIRCSAIRAGPKDWARFSRGIWRTRT